MHFRFSLIFILLCFIKLNGQNAALDSLYNQLSEAETAEEQVKANIELAKLYRKLNLDSVRKYGLAALQASKKLENKELQCDCYFALASGYSNRYITEITDTVWMYIDSAENLSGQINYQRGIAEAQYFHGYVNMVQNNFKTSAPHLIKAEEMFSALRDTQKLAEVKQSIGYYYIVVEQYEKALPYILESKSLFEKLEQYENLIYTLNNIAAIYFSMHDTVETAKTVRENYTVSMQHGQLDDKIRACESLASQFVLLNNLDSAEYYYKEAIKLADFPDGERYLDLTYRNLSVIYNKKEEYKQEEEYLLKALNISKKTQQSDRELAYLYDLSTFYDSIKEYKKSLSYLKEYTVLRDSLKFSDAGHLLDQALSDKELEARIEELNELRIQQASMMNKNVLLPILCLLSFLVFFSYWFYQNRLLYQLQKSITRTTEQQKVQNFWRITLPETKGIKNSYLLIAAVFYAGLTLLLLHIFYETLPLNLISVSSFALLALLFYISYRALVLTQKQTLNSAGGELFRILLLALIMPVITSLIAIAIYPDAIALKSFVYPLMSGLIAPMLTLLFLQIIDYQQRYNTMLNSLLDHINKALTQKETKVPVENRNNIIQIEDNDIVLDHILYIVSENVYQEIICHENGKLDKKLVRKTLSVLEQELENHSNFIRCHRSYIINLSKVLSVTGNSRQQFFIVEGSKEKVPISRSLANTILSHFEELVN